MYKVGNIYFIAAVAVIGMSTLLPYTRDLVALRTGCFARF